MPVYSFVYCDLEQFIFQRIALHIVLNVSDKHFWLLNRSAVRSQKRKRDSARDYSDVENWAVKKKKTEALTV